MAVAMQQSQRDFEYCAINETVLRMPVKVMHSEPNEPCERNFYQLRVLIEIMARAVFQGKEHAQCPKCVQSFERIVLEKELVEADKAIRQTEHKHQFTVTGQQLALAGKMAEEAEKNGYNMTMQEAIELWKSIRPRYCAISKIPLSMPVKIIHTVPNAECDVNSYQLQAIIERMAQAIVQGKGQAQCPCCQQDFTEIVLEKDLVESDDALRHAEQPYEFKVSGFERALAVQMTQKAKQNGHKLTMKEAKTIEETLLSSGSSQCSQGGTKLPAPAADQKCDLLRLAENMRSMNIRNKFLLLAILGGGLFVAHRLWQRLFGTDEGSVRSVPTTTVDLARLRSRVTAR